MAPLLQSLGALHLIITACSCWVTPDERGRIQRHPSRHIPRFYEQSPSRNAFKLPSGVAAGAGAGMYGIAGPSYKDGELALVKYDTVSGNTTTVQTPSTAFLSKLPSTGESLGCLDAVHSVFFFIYEEADASGGIVAGLYPYNLADPSVQYDPILLPSIYADEIVGAGSDLIFNFVFFICFVYKIFLCTHFLHILLFDF